jgi:RHS repeat-associated protein
MGDRLIAEYDHVGARFLYYTPDQINTTRVITDQGGSVVYSVVHDPYGGIQQTGTNNTYDPQLKFSGKERDAESGLDYFGARYYDKNQYRFISVDPAVTRRFVQLEPQKWNFYAYCLGNPICFLDPTGRWGSSAHYGQTYSIAIFVNMPKGLADDISQACMNVDLDLATTAGDLNNPRTWPATTKNALNGTMEKWHFPDDKMLDEHFRICQTTLNPKEFGKHLHAIQDIYSHKGYGAPFGHGLDSSVDDPNKHPAAYEMMCWMTLELMTDFYDRLMAAAVAAATQAAICIAISFAI